MELKIVQPDPFNILAGTKKVVENSKHVFIKEEKIADFAKKVSERFNKGLDGGVMGLSVTGNIENDVQLAFIEDAANFCFWPSKGESKWQVKLDSGELTQGGWFGLVYCFKRAIKNGVPITDAKYLAEMTLEDAQKIFEGVNGIEIPLLKERTLNLIEAGKILLEKFNGKFLNVLEKANYDAIKLTQLIIDNFSSFQDKSYYEGEEVNFLKRAQIMSSDIQYVLTGTGKEIKNLDKLTAFTDYKLPQLLRMFGILEYEKELADIIDNYIEIPHDSEEEVEIRAATVWAVELIRQKIPKLTARDIDNTIWIMSQDIQGEAKPYHRSRTIYY